MIIRIFPFFFFFVPKWWIGTERASFLSSMMTKNRHDLCTRWTHEAIIQGTHLGVGDEALTILNFNGGKLMAAGSMKHPFVRAHLLRRMEYEVRKKNIGLGRRLRAGEDQTFLVLFEILNRDIKASLGNKDISQ